jgi:membrane dipeptidase
VPDSILARIPDNGGVVMVTYVPDFVSQDIADWEQRFVHVRDSMIAAGASEPELTVAREAYRKRSPRPLATLADVADHIEHVRDVAGVDHVGIGSDYDGMGTPPVGLDDVSTYPDLFAELLRRGWTETDLGKLASGNIMRALRAAEAVSRRLQAETRPSTATPIPTS